MNHSLRCRCGTVKGYVSHPERVSRGVCYCSDCQSFAHFLGKPTGMLDEMGGTDVIATVSSYVTITQGLGSLACMSLSNGGMLRWYASCCKTPIGNTPRNFKIPHVGLIHSCLEDPAKSLDASFGPIRMRVNLKSAKGKPKAMTMSTTLAVLRFAKLLLRSRLDGTYRRTPFFSTQAAPLVLPQVLTLAERNRLKESVSQS